MREKLGPGSRGHITLGIKQKAKEGVRGAARSPREFPARRGLMKTALEENSPKPEPVSFRLPAWFRGEKQNRCPCSKVYVLTGYTVSSLGADAMHIVGVWQRQLGTATKEPAPL